MILMHRENQLTIGTNQTYTWDGNPNQSDYTDAYEDDYIEQQDSKFNVKIIAKDGDTQSATDEEIFSVETFSYWMENNASNCHHYEMDCDE